MPNLRQKESAVAIALDIEKPFDSVLHKLFATNLCPLVIKHIDSFLRERRFYTNIANTSSDYGQIGRGVPQWSNLSPFLFYTLMYDFADLYGGSTSLLNTDIALEYPTDIRWLCDMQSFILRRFLKFMKNGSEKSILTRNNLFALGILTLMVTDTLWKRLNFLHL